MDKMYILVEHFHLYNEFVQTFFNEPSYWV